MQLTLNIPEDKLPFFLELIENLEFVQLEQNAPIQGLTQHQKELVDIELQKAKDDPDYMLDWDVAKKQIDWDAC